MLCVLPTHMGGWMEFRDPGFSLVQPCCYRWLQNEPANEIIPYGMLVLQVAVLLDKPSCQPQELDYLRTIQMLQWLEQGKGQRGGQKSEQETGLRQVHNDETTNWLFPREITVSS